MTTLVGWVENEYWNLINFTMFIPLFSRLRAFVSFLLLLPLMACCGSSQSVAQTDGLGTFSMAEVAKHNTEKSAWMAIDGLVCVFVTPSLVHSFAFYGNLLCFTQFPSSVTISHTSTTLEESEWCKTQSFARSLASFLSEDLYTSFFLIR